MIHTDLFLLPFLGHTTYLHTFIVSFSLGPSPAAARTRFFRFYFSQHTPHSLEDFPNQNGNHEKYSLTPDTTRRRRRLAGLGRAMTNFAWDGGATDWWSGSDRRSTDKTHDGRDTPKPNSRRNRNGLTDGRPRERKNTDANRADL